MTEQPENGSISEPQETINTLPPPGPAPRPLAWRLPTALIALVLIGGLLWWNGRTPDSGQLRATPTPVAIATLVTPTPRPPTATPSPAPTATATMVAASVVLPTVTPTVAPTPVPTRTVELGGQITLRLELANPSFSASGRPLDISLEPRTFVLGGDVNTVADRWCVALGASGLVFDLTLRLNPANETVSVMGEMQLYDGFCHDLGPRRATAPLQVDIPTDASARLVQSLHAESNLLDLSDLLRTSTGVFAEITIRNPRPR